MPPSILFIGINFILGLVALPKSLNTHTIEPQYALAYHLTHIADNGPAAKKSIQWLQSCPTITPEETGPNSVIGSIIALEEMLSNQFDFVLTTLIHCGYDINEKDTIGLTPLHAAILYNNLKAVDVLIKLGADRELKLSDRAAEKTGELNALEFAKYLNKNRNNSLIINHLSQPPDSQ